VAEVEAQVEAAAAQVDLGQAAVLQ